MFKAIRFILDPHKNEFLEILSALLDQYNFEGIYENDQNVIAYINEENIFEEDTLSQIKIALYKIGCNVSWQIENLPEQNWNKIWESNFEPIAINEMCIIRAPFHPEFKDFQFQIIIEPKMSFGTGHHQTTRLMIEQMLEMDLKGRSVLDMGCGTGVLGILAAQKKASCVIAADIDKWAFKNATENVRRNKTKQISVIHGNTKSVINERLDIILANINLNVLIEQIKDYSIILKPGGILLVSGILKEDFYVMKEAADKHAFTFVRYTELDDWIAILFERN